MITSSSKREVGESSISRARISGTIEAVRPSALQPIEDRLVAMVRRQAHHFRAARLNKGAGIYNAGDCDKTIYFLEEGTVKISVPTSAGRSCLLDFHRAPMIFGEIPGLNGERADMAVARTPVLLRKVPRIAFVEMMRNEDLLLTFTWHLGRRITEYQQIVTEFATCSAEARLAATLIRLGKKLGYVQSGELCLDEPLSCQDLSEMVGTTRSRVGYFLARFRALNFVTMDPDCRLRIRENQLSAYLDEDDG